MGNHIWTTTALTVAVIITVTVALSWVLALDERRHNRRVIARLTKARR